jgi:hypothetical protein
MDSRLYDLYVPDSDVDLADLRRARLDRFAAAAPLDHLLPSQGAWSFAAEAKVSVDRVVAHFAADYAEALLAELESRELAAGEGAP